MRVKAKESASRAFGMHSSEIVIEISTVEGTAYAIIDRLSLENGGVEIGYPVGAKNGKYLVELPRETLQGSWRVWVDSSELLEDRLEKIA